ncbi:2-dehydropantoate 2-reductase [Streptacidiphilus jiangxiensis]|uniref:2-dehydropantoate 2-reductase n=1 Tax=Streptacidiphilus jiangxiensis TaxID=235985 RepID=A0A1H7U9Q6_STRJI|nr:2-dehydropantoate 2-reductase [Streptacidiphilus jiangxiensis]SEL93752.1 2-dehydropantoate 2-reductase [Streptacidiphilus jiangxiensis]
MRIAVMGAGSIGCHLGGHLAQQSDVEVTLIGRAAAMDVLAKDGLTLTSGRREPLHLSPGTLTLATDASGAVGADVVLVTVKSDATRDAARELAPHLAPGAVVVSFQNGLHNAEALREELPQQTVLTGMVPYNVLQTEPGRFHQGTGGALMLDDAPAGTPLVAALTASGLRVQARPDMREVQYAKLLMNLNNAVNALSGVPLRAELGDRSYRTCLALCQREALAAYRAAGITPAQLGAVRPNLTPLLLRLPDAVFTRAAKAMLAIDATARSSMWEDLQRGRRTEVDSLQGEIVTLATRHGLTAPANARLAELVHAAEQGGRRSWSGPDLLAALRG